MIVKAKRNLFICADDDFDYVYINPERISSIENYYDGKSIIRISSDLAYICEDSFQQLMTLMDSYKSHYLNRKES